MQFKKDVQVNCYSAALLQCLIDLLISLKFLSGYKSCWSCLSMFHRELPLLKVKWSIVAQPFKGSGF